MPPTITADLICRALTTAPSWARLALAAPNPRLRERAGTVLAERMLDAFVSPPTPIADVAQLPLPL